MVTKKRGRRRRIKRDIPIYDKERNMILQFRGEYEWLSNFYQCEVEYEGELYPSVENAYQAAKTYQFNRKRFKNCSPSEARKLGKRIPMEYGFDSRKIKIMKQLLISKFTRNPELKEKLLTTGNAILVEGNTWGDKFWGVDLNSPCKECEYGYEGKNMLGKLLMEVREELRNNQ